MRQLAWRSGRVRYRIIRGGSSASTNQKSLMIERPATGPLSVDANVYDRAWLSASSMVCMVTSMPFLCTSLIAPLRGDGSGRSRAGAPCSVVVRGSREAVEILRKMNPLGTQYESPAGTRSPATPSCAAQEEILTNLVIRRKKILMFSFLRERPASGCLGPDQKRNAGQDREVKDAANPPTGFQRTLHAHHSAKRQTAL